MNRTTAITLLTLAAAAPRTIFAQSTTALKAAGVAEESATPVLWGIQSGMFRRAGLVVDLSPQTSGSAIAAGVAGGTYQIGKSSIVPLITAFSKKIPIKLVAPGGLYSAAHPTIALLVRTDSPIRTAGDLSGKVVGVSSPDDLFALGTKAWTDTNGGNASTLQFIGLPQSEIEGALAAGRIDAGASATPDLQSALDSGKVRILADMENAIASEFMFTAWFTSDSTLTSERAHLATFSRIERQAAAYVNGHHPETVDVLAKFTRVAPAIISRMTRAQMGTTLDPKLIQPVIDACARYKVIAAPFDANTMIASGMG